MRQILAAVCLVLCSAAGVAAQPVVFLVRHAERADAGMASAKTPGTDPDLSGAGIARANALAAMLKDAKITAVITTEYKRTRHTGEPAAKAAGLPLTVVESKDAAGLLAKVKAAHGNVLVVGHSNTVPELLKGLGVTEPVVITDDEYDAMFIVTRSSPPTMVRLRYR
jgi:broad specificity phosphatase PhoE